LAERTPGDGQTGQGRTALTASTATLVAVIILLQLVASFCYPIAKYGLDIIEPFTFAFFRFILASAALLIAACFARKDRPVERKDYKRIFSLGILIIPLNQTLFLVGQSLTGAGHGAFLFATTPVWIFALALIHLKETFYWQRAIGIGIATLGVLVIMISGGLEVSRDYIIGDLTILVSVIAWAYYTILGKPLVQKYGAIRVTAYALASGSLVYLPIGLFFAMRYDYSQATAGAWWSVVYMAIGLSLIVYVLWYWVLKQMDASRLAVYHNVQPVIASAVAYFWLGESLSPAFVFGGLVVLVGVLVTEIRRKPHKETPAAG